MIMPINHEQHELKNETLTPIWDLGHYNRHKHDYHSEAINLSIFFYL